MHIRFTPILGYIFARKKKHKKNNSRILIFFRFLTFSYANSRVCSLWQLELISKSRNFSDRRQFPFFHMQWQTLHQDNFLFSRIFWNFYFDVFVISTRSCEQSHIESNIVFFCFVFIVIVFFFIFLIFHGIYKNVEYAVIIEITMGE